MVILVILASSQGQVVLVLARMCRGGGPKASPQGKKPRLSDTTDVGDGIDVPAG